LLLLFNPNAQPGSPEPRGAVSYWSGGRGGSFSIHEHVLHVIKSPFNSNGRPRRELTSIATSVTEDGAPTSLLA